MSGRPAAPGSDQTESRQPERTRKVRKSKKVTEGYIERAAMHYLGRFNSSEQNLVRVLGRKVRRRNEDGALPTAEQQQWIANVTAKCVRYGYINDEQYAQQRAEGLLRKGKPLRVIVQDLCYKGISRELADTTINALLQDDGVSPDEQAAAAYVRRRRFGVFRRETADVDQKREKETAAMMRAGFRFDIIKRTLEMSEDEIIDLLR